MAIISAVQMNSSHDLDENLKTAERLIAEAADQGAEVIVLPENFALMPLQLKDRLKFKESKEGGPIHDFLRKLAQRHKVWLVAGTIPYSSNHEEKVRAACLVFNAQGDIVAHYDKMHMFDVSIYNHENYQESSVIEAGNQIVVVDTPVGKIGLAVCYDIRFPELFRCLFHKGAEIFVLPSAFTKATGGVHWEILSRARAIENFAYFVGCGQTGVHSNGRETYGHSLIVEPWGSVVSSIAEREGTIHADIDLDYLHKIRHNMAANVSYKITFSSIPEERI